jgi:hypothetical protein
MFKIMKKEKSKKLEVKNKKFTEDIDSGHAGVRAVRADDRAVQLLAGRRDRNDTEVDEIKAKGQGPRDKDR